MAESSLNGNGWKAAAILGTVLIFVLGVAANSITRARGLDEQIALMVYRQSKIEMEMSDIKQELVMLRRTVQQFNATMIRVSESNCWVATGKPCPVGLIDATP